jgi:hypothetical protein
VASSSILQQVRGFDVAVQPAVRDDLDHVLDVIEDEERVDEHEEGFRKAGGVRRRDRDARLEVADHVVGQEADSAAGEARQAGARFRVLRVREVVPRHLLLDLDQRIDAVCRVGVRAAAVDAVRLRADEAVAGQPLAALHRLQQERMLPARHLEERRDGRLQVGRHVAEDRYEIVVASFGYFEDLFQCWLVVH